VYRETHRRVQFLTAAASMNRKFVGFFARLMNSSEHHGIYAAFFRLTSTVVPVSRAADNAKPGTGQIRLSLTDPCLVLGEGTRFTAEFKPRMQIMLPKTLNSVVAEVAEIINDTEMRIKKEFGGESGKGTARIREKLTESQGKGLDFKTLPFVDQQDMYRHVYQCLKDAGCIGIFPEGTLTHIHDFNAESISMFFRR
jgi:glycerol-3-phosphate O-acyltransferase/dihydroxyacetone phosphate acyltransferase